MGKNAKKQRKAEAKAAKASAKEARRPLRSSPPSGSFRVHRPRSLTGESDQDYDLVSVLYHALSGAEACGTYLRDAEAIDDDELAEFFEDTRAEYVARAQTADRGPHAAATARR
jgi:hypothetical protein